MIHHQNVQRLPNSSTIYLIKFDDHRKTNSSSMAILILSKELGGHGFKNLTNTTSISRKILYYVLVFLFSFLFSNLQRMHDKAVI